MEDYDHSKPQKVVRGIALYLLSGAAAFGMEVVVWSDRGWTKPVAWWLQVFLPASLWMLTPYAAMSRLILKKEQTLRQEVLLLFGSLAMCVFALFILFDGFFVHRDPRSWILFILVPVYQWIAFAGTLGMRAVIGKQR